MYVFCFLLWAFIVLVLWRNRGYDQAFVKQHITKKRGMLGLFCASLWIFDRFMKKGPVQRLHRKEENWSRGVYVKEQPQIRLRADTAKRAATGVLIVTTGLLAVGGLLVLEREEAVYEEALLARPEFGESREYELEVEGIIDETTVPVTVVVEGRQPYADTMSQIFLEAFETIKTRISKTYGGLEAIRSDIHLPATTNYGIRVEWTSLNPEVMSDWGDIVTEHIPEEGIVLSLLARLTYSSYEAQYELPIRILPPEKDSSFYIGLLNAYIQKQNKERGEDEYLVMPEELEELTLRYRMPQERYAHYLFFLVPVSVLLVWMIGHNQLKKMHQKRSEQLGRDYVVLVSKMSLLVQSGLTIRAAWERIAAAYQERLETGTEESYLYEEMLRTKRQIQTGMHEGTAYAEFGRRCGGYSYIKFGNLLEQNLRQGVAGISNVLEQQMHQALEERRNHVMRLGEVISTKMLLPMMLMLVVVMLIVIVPALMSIQL